MNPDDLNEDTLLEMLTSRTGANELDDYFGRELRKELSELAQLSPKTDGAATRGAVRKLFVLPGIMGTKLGVADSTGDVDGVWINPFALRKGRIKDLRWGQEPDPVRTNGVLWSAYMRMKLRLRWEGYDVEFIEQDWRHSVETLGARTAKIVTESGDPAAMICHSMGGLIARKVAELTNAEQITNIVTVGTPNQGAYAGVMVMRMVHDMVQMIGRLDKKHGPKAVVNDYLRHFPGMLEMMPSRAKRPGEDYFDPDWWPSGGVVPMPDALKAAATAQETLMAPDDRFYQIIGVDQETVVGATKKATSIDFHKSNDGDGTVPRDLATWGDPKGRYYYPGSHGWLMNQTPVIYGAIDLLETGTTDRLATKAPASRSSKKITEKALRGENAKGLSRTNDEAFETFSEAALMASFAGVGEPDFPEDDPLRAHLADAPPPPPTSNDPMEKRTYSYIKSSTPRRRMNVDLMHGNILHAATEAYVVGVFQGVPSLGGAAGVIDEALDGALSDMYDDGQITGRLGEVTFVPTPRYLLRTAHVVVVGLGPLQPAEKLKSAIGLAARNLTRALCISKISSIATVLWGSGSGLQGRETFKALFDGMFDSLRRWDPDQTFDRIIVCEYRKEVHTILEEELSAIFARFSVDDTEIVMNVGALAPSRADRALAAPKAATAHHPDNLTVQGEVLGDADDPQLRLDVTFARGTTGSKYGDKDTAALPTSSKVIFMSELDQLVNRLRKATTAAALKPLADKLFNLVLDADMAKKLKLDPAGGLTITNNPWGSRVPWELLHANGQPIALDGGVHRRYLPSSVSVSRSGTTARQMDDGAVKQLLLVVNPTQDLAGAQAEGKAVAGIFDEKLKQIRLADRNELFQKEATLNAVTQRLENDQTPIDILHYAGHAFFDPDDPSRSGLVMHGRETLTGTSIAGLARVPRVVFLNACESGRVRRSDPDDRNVDDVPAMEFFGRSVGLAEAFILGGVSHLIGTIWPVGDADAVNFARSFYNEAVVTDLRKAVTKARKDLAKGNSTAWVNYMHYGGPNSFL